MQRSGELQIQHIKGGCSGLDKEGGGILSSMQSKVNLWLLIASAAAANGGAVQNQSVPYPAPQVSGPALSSGIASDIDRWNALRQSDNLPFSSYATFLLSHRDWPGEAGMRRAA